MIRKALETDFPTSATDECLIRICGLKNAYGSDVPFIQFFTDGQGCFLSVMDGVGVFYARELTDEWHLFLQMNPDIRSLHCSGHIGDSLLNTSMWQGRRGIVMRFDGSAEDMDPLVCTEPYLPDVYELLKENFESISDFNYWYPDVSHRVRHGCCHIACVIQANRVISTAMTVAETEQEAIIGQVATDSAFRHRGLAGKCVKSTIFQCKGKTLYILPIHDQAAKLYRQLGFIECGTWTELQKLY